MNPSVEMSSLKKRKKPLRTSTDWPTACGVQEVIGGARVPDAMPWPLMQLDASRLLKGQQHKKEQQHSVLFGALCYSIGAC